MKKLIFSFILIINLNFAFANNITLQHAGELGTGVVGFGMNYKLYRGEILYGYHDDAETYALRNSFKIFSYKNLFLNLGLSVYHVELSDKPRRAYSKGYYEQAVNQRAYLFYNIEFKNQTHGVYFENGINDVNAEVYYNNNVPLDELMSIGIGYRFYFNE